MKKGINLEREPISERGGVFGAMDTMYQRGKIQEQSMCYEHKKHDGSLPLVGVNTFLPREHADEIATEIELIRSTEEEKGQQIENVRGWQQSRNVLAPVGETDHGHFVDEPEEASANNATVRPERSAQREVEGHALAYLQKTAQEWKNVFAASIEAAKAHSSGRISHAYYLGGEYRRNM